MIRFIGDAKAVVISHEDFIRDYEHLFHDHHLIERIPDGEQYHLLPAELLETYDLDFLRSGGYEPCSAAVFVFDPQHSGLFEQRSSPQRARYHIAIIGEARLYVVQRQEWFLEQAKADFQS